ncbi:MAG: glucose-6-phosphate dehydrogenase [Planctomycetota bacterium]|jgi:glucose-6-phosphate 1-dehydrogenase
MAKTFDRLSIVVVGASGDLARRKIFPALFALHCQGLLPKRSHVFGFARSQLSDEDFRARIMEHLTCRYTPGESCAELMDEFLGRCSYVSGSYESRDSFLDLYQRMRQAEGEEGANRFYYLAIPPSVFLDVAHAIGDAGLVSCGPTGPWSRVVIEKPFGRDRASSDRLTCGLARVFAEDQTFRIDHYLGKEVIQNLLVLRFANVVFEPLWNRRFIRKIEIVWKEDIGLKGRGGYFDQYGIVRDVMQNHLMQILALVAMEPPNRLESANVAAEKAKVLRSVLPLKREDLILGQYRESVRNGRRFPAYVEDPGVPDTSNTPTFAATKLKVDTPRWQGVPFLISAGKGVDARMTEIRIYFHDMPRNMFCDPGGCPDANQLIIRVQPDEAIYLSVVSKVPGMGMKLTTRDLDLQYKEAFSELIPDAYESLLLDVVEGDRSLFIRSDELEAAWDIFTPVLHEIEEREVVPEGYDFGGPGPATAAALVP